MNSNKKQIMHNRGHQKWLKNGKLRRPILSAFYNISQRNFGILLILWCSFKLWWNVCLDLSRSKFCSLGNRSFGIAVRRSLFKYENLWHAFGTISAFVIFHYTFLIYFQKGKHPLTLILNLVLTFNKRNCAKTKQKNDYWYKTWVTNRPFAAGLKTLCITTSGHWYLCLQVQQIHLSGKLLFSTIFSNICTLWQHTYSYR
jgi:hypothetical protein